MAPKLQSTIFIVDMYDYYRTMTFGVNLKGPWMNGKRQRPTDAEVEILSVLWDHGPATVREVHTELSGQRDVGYTTVLKQMQIMTERQLLVRDESQRSHIYRPKQKAEAMQRSIVKDLISRVFSGSTENLVMRAISANKATPEQIAQIRKMLDDLEGQDS